MYFRNIGRKVIFKDQALHEELDCLTRNIKKLCTFETSDVMSSSKIKHWTKKWTAWHWILINYVLSKRRT